MELDLGFLKVRITIQIGAGIRVRVFKLGLGFELSVKFDIAWNAEVHARVKVKCWVRVMFGSAG